MMQNPPGSLEELLTTYAHSPTPEQQAQLVRQYSGLVRTLVRRIPTSDPRQLECAGTQALICALEAYCPQVHPSFTHFARPYIRQALRRAVRSAPHPTDWDQPDSLFSPGT